MNSYHLVLNTRKIKKLTKIEFKGAFSQIIIQQACICAVAYVFNSLFLKFFSQTISLFMAAFFAGVIFLMSFYVLFIYNIFTSPSGKQPKLATMLDF